MHRRFTDQLWRSGVGAGMVAGAAVLSILIFRLDFQPVARIAPFLFLIAVLGSSWLGSYTGGVTSVLLVVILSVLFSRRTLDLTRVDYSRFILLLLLSGAVSWIEAQRRRVEAELRKRVEQKTAELRMAVEQLKREVEERKAGEQEIRRLNTLLELRVDERTRQLELANQELESFSYSVSHDLRAPLRSIDGFSRILLENCDSKLNPEEKGLFRRILGATSRMSELIDDLLNLARVTRTTINREQVDLSILASRMADEFKKEHPESKAEFIIEPGLWANGDRGLIEAALRNLMENAWKFSSLAPLPCVEFGSTSVTGERVFFVRDNGAGFDPAYKSKLFTPFQRLHRQEEFSGTGIGLATASRIVRRHGGWISAESEPGKGATFFFTLASPIGNLEQSPVETDGVYRPDEPKPLSPRLEAPNSSSSHSTLM